jgi:hypothetical protein
LRQQPRQQQQQPAVPPKPKVKVHCRLDAATGEVVISHNDVDIIKVRCREIHTAFVAPRQVCCTGTCALIFEPSGS